METEWPDDEPCAWCGEPACERSCTAARVQAVGACAACGSPLMADDGATCPACGAPCC